MKLDKQDWMGFAFLMEHLHFRLALTRSKWTRYRRTGFYLLGYARIDWRMNEHQRLLAEGFLEKHGIPVRHDGKIVTEEHVGKLLDLFEPWEDYLKHPEEIGALRYWVENPVPYDDEEVFRDYVREIDALL